MGGVVLFKGSVMAQTRLFDIRKHDYPPKEGSVFRSLQVFRCFVCGARTNRAVVSCWPDHGVRAVCAYAGEEWHDGLRQMAAAFGTAHPEVGRLRALHQIVARDDIVGTPDFTQVWPATPELPLVLPEQASAY
jgi:hypothetical protein